MFQLIGRLGLAYALLLAVFLSSLVLSALIPSEILRPNIGRTLLSLQGEGLYPSLALPWKNITLDNDDEAVMYNIAYTSDASRPLQSAMTNPRVAISTEELDQIRNFEAMYAGTANVKILYERYWHGYLVFLRPALTFLSYVEIRHALTALLLLGTGWLLLLAKRRVGIKVSLALLFGLIVVDVPYVGQLIQFSSVFLIGLFASIYYLATYKKQKTAYALFFTVGGITSFFDLLTAPLIPLGLLLILSVCLDEEKRILEKCLAWVAGYSLLWSSKWFLAQWLFVPDALLSVTSRIFQRTTGYVDEGFNNTLAILQNVRELFSLNEAGFFALLAIVFIGVVMLLRYGSWSIGRFRNIVPWLLVGATPYVWYFVLANHSYLHAWFTYRNQFMTIVALSIIFAELVVWEHVRRDILFLYRKLLHMRSLTNTSESS